MGKEVRVKCRAFVVRPRAHVSPLPPPTFTREFQIYYPKNYTVQYHLNASSTVHLLFVLYPCWEVHIKYGWTGKNG